MLYLSFLALQLPIFVVPLRLFQLLCTIINSSLLKWMLSSYSMYCALVIHILAFYVLIFGYVIFLSLKVSPLTIFCFFFNFFISLSLNLFLAVLFHYPIQWNLFPTSLLYYTYQELPKTLPSMEALSHILPFIHFWNSCQLFLPRACTSDSRFFSNIFKPF